MSKALRSLQPCACALSLLLAAAVAQAQAGAQYAVGISGLHCAAQCGREAGERIGRLPGVAEVEVNRNTRTVLVTMQPSAGLDRQAVAGALQGSDFSVTTFEPVRRPAPPR